MLAYTIGMNKRFYFTLLALLQLVTALAVTKTDTIRSLTMRDDMVEISYELRYSDGQVIVDFMNARAILKGRNRQYSNVKVMFTEGPNVNLPAREVQIKTELKNKGKRLDAFTISDGVDYIRQSSTNNDELFIVNDNGNKPSLTFEVNGEKKFLEVPVYLSEYKYKGAKGIGKLKVQKQKTTYEIFDQFGPLKINLSEALRAKSVQPSHNSITPATNSETTIEEKVEVINNGGDDGGMEYELLGLNQDAGSDGGAGGGGADGGGQVSDDNSKEQADSAAAEAQKKADAEAEKNRKQQWWMFIIAAVLGVLGFGGSQVAQHVRNNRNQRNMMDLQNNVVKRAENEAKRRAQSLARNKTHQAVNKVRTKGRQAVRSNVTRIGDSVKGKRTADGNNTGQSPAPSKTKPSTGSIRRLPGKKKDNNGGISI